MLGCTDIERPSRCSEATRPDQAETLTRCLSVTERNNLLPYQSSIFCHARQRLGVPVRYRHDSALLYRVATNDSGWRHASPPGTATAEVESWTCPGRRYRLESANAERYLARVWQSSHSAPCLHGVPQDLSQACAAGLGSLCLRNPSHHPAWPPYRTSTEYPPGARARCHGVTGCVTGA